MQFEDSFTLTSSEADISASLTLSPHTPPVGVYQVGLLVVLGQELSKQLTKSWQWLLGSDAIPLVYTAFGDFFFWSAQYKSIFFLEVQRGQSTFVCTSVEALFNEFLSQSGVIKEILHQADVDRLVTKFESINYGACFIAEPWQAVGGSGELNTYSVGSVVVYNVLVAKYVYHRLSAERQSS